MRTTVFFSVLLALLFVASLAAAHGLPAPAGFVNDFAGILTPDAKAALEAKLQAFERESNHEISIATVANLEGDTIEGFAEEVFEAWGIGKEKADNGVLILVALEERAMRIEVGYGLEGALTDAQSFWIIEKVMKPAFQAGDFSTGLDGAVDKIIAATRGEAIPNYVPSPLRNIGNSSNVFLLPLFFFMWLTSVLARSKSWWAGGIIGAGIGTAIGFVFGFLYAGVAWIAILSLFGLLLDYLVSNASARGATTGHIPWWAGGHRRGPWGGGGFGGFGGGRSGGGGASGRW